MCCVFTFTLSGLQRKKLTIINGRLQHPSTDSTVAAPPKPAIFFLNERFMTARHAEGSYGKIIFHSYIFLVGKGLSNDGVGVARGTAFREIRSGVGFKTVDFVKEKLGGATVVRLLHATRPGLLDQLTTILPSNSNASTFKTRAQLTRCRMLHIYARTMISTPLYIVCTRTAKGVSRFFTSSAERPASIPISRTPSVHPDQQNTQRSSR